MNNRTTLVATIFIGCFGTLYSYWDQIGSGSQVTPPTPTSRIAEENKETKTSKVRDYTVQVSLLSQLKTILDDQFISNDKKAEAINHALDRIRVLGSPVTEGLVDDALNDPAHASGIIQQAIDELDSWYGNLPASD